MPEWSREDVDRYWQGREGRERDEDRRAASWRGTTWLGVWSEALALHRPVTVHCGALVARGGVVALDDAGGEALVCSVPGEHGGHEDATAVHARDAALEELMIAQNELAETQRNLQVAISSLDELAKDGSEAAQAARMKAQAPVDDLWTKAAADEARLHDLERDVYESEAERDTYVIAEPGERSATAMHTYVRLDGEGPALLEEDEGPAGGIRSETSPAHTLRGGMERVLRQLAKRALVGEEVTAQIVLRGFPSVVTGIVAGVNREIVHIRSTQGTGWTCRVGSVRGVQVPAWRRPS
ncbi:MAG: hypothetical protein IT198_14135 [Acidimicrobiia bacterium]|nr:hypothetical protein [Acidimicrobiia bacterium]